MAKATQITLAMLLAMLLCVGCEDERDSSNAGAVGASSRQSDTSTSSTIPWDQAADHVGEYVTVKGRVVGTHFASGSRGSPTFLNIGKPYPDPGRFTIVIWGENRSKFDGSPEDTYRGKMVEVTGTVSEYEGSPQIEAAHPDQITTAE
mgnify:FL=1